MFQDNKICPNRHSNNIKFDFVDDFENPTNKLPGNLIRVKFYFLNRPKISKYSQTIEKISCYLMLN